MRTQSRHLVKADFVRFCLVGAVCAACNLVLLWSLTELAHSNYLVSCSISFLIINGLGFIANKYFVFRQRDSKWVPELARYYSTMLGSLLLNLGLMALLVEIALLNYLLASVYVTILLALLNFIAHAYWSFNPRDRWKRMANDD